MDIKCSRCEGIGSEKEKCNDNQFHLTICMKCRGHGGLDWVDNVLGETKREFASFKICFCDTCDQIIIKKLGDVK